MAELMQEISRTAADAFIKRTSSATQRDSCTIEMQRSRGAQLLNARGIIILPSFDYEDAGVEGTLLFDERPDGARLMRDIKAGKIKRVFCYRVDRLGRDTYVILDFARFCTRHGVYIYSLTEEANTETEHGLRNFKRLANEAELERDGIVMRTIDGMDTLAREGVWLGGPIPYGFIVMGSRRRQKLRISEEPIPGLALAWSMADVVREIYRLMVEEKRSSVYIAKYLNKLDIPASRPPKANHDPDDIAPVREKRKRATVWTASRVRSLAVNTLYKGEHRFGVRSKHDREAIEISVPAIVSSETWDLAQRTLRDNQRFSDRNARRNYLLRGLITCVYCGRAYVGTSNTSRSGECTLHYRCNGKHIRELSGEPSVEYPSKWVTADIDDAVWYEIERYLRNPTSIIQSLMVVHANEYAQSVSGLYADLARTQQALQETFRNLDELISMRMMRLMSNERMLNHQERVARQQEALLDRERTLSLEISHAEENKAQLQDVDSYIRALNSKLDCQLTWSLKRRLVELLVECVRVLNVMENGTVVIHVEITYRFPDVTHAPQLATMPNAQGT